MNERTDEEWRERKRREIGDCCPVPQLPEWVDCWFWFCTGCELVVLLECLIKFSSNDSNPVKFVSFLLAWFVSLVYGSHILNLFLCYFYLTFPCGFRIEGLTFDPGQVWRSELADSSHLTPLSCPLQQIHLIWIPK